VAAVSASGEQRPPSSGDPGLMASVANINDINEGHVVLEME
jgi:hypothetical protein